MRRRQVDEVDVSSGPLVDSTASLGLAEGTPLRSNDDPRARPDKNPRRPASVSICSLRGSIQNGADYKQAGREGGSSIDMLDGEDHNPALPKLAAWLTLRVRAGTSIKLASTTHFFKSCSSFNPIAVRRARPCVLASPGR